MLIQNHSCFLLSRRFHVLEVEFIKSLKYLIEFSFMNIFYF